MVRLEWQKDKSAQMIKRIIAIAEHVSYFLFVDVVIVELSILFFIMVLLLLLVLMQSILLLLKFILKVFLFIFCDYPILLLEILLLIMIQYLFFITNFTFGLILSLKLILFPKNIIISMTILLIIVEMCLVITHLLNPSFRIKFFFLHCKVIIFLMLDL